MGYVQMILVNIFIFQNFATDVALIGRSLEVDGLYVPLDISFTGEVFTTSHTPPDNFPGLFDFKNHFMKLCRGIEWP